jgi:hypothetical protein
MSSQAQAGVPDDAAALPGWWRDGGRSRMSSQAQAGIPGAVGA